MAEELNRFGVHVLAWCFMTNHTHLIVVLNDSAVKSPVGVSFIPLNIVSTIRIFWSKID